MTNPNTAAHPDQYAQPNSKAAIEVRPEDLPIHCPTEGSALWNSHPMVYIPVAENGGEARCPYCGTLYKLTGELPPAC